MFAVDRRVKLTTLFTMCFALFMAMLDNTVVNVALPTIQRDFGSGVSGLQWIISAYTLFFASLMLTGGMLGDLYGRKRLFLAGLVIFSSGSLLCGLAPSLHWLIAGRAFQGVGAAALLVGVPPARAEATNAALEFATAKNRPTPIHASGPPAQANAASEASPKPTQKLVLVRKLYREYPVGSVYRSGLFAA